MRKVYILAVIAIFVMIPFATFAKTAMSDNDMASVTAKQGIMITNIGNIQQWQMAKFMGYSKSDINRNNFFVTLINCLQGKGVIRRQTGSDGRSGLWTSLNDPKPTINLRGFFDRIPPVTVP